VSTALRFLGIQVIRRITIKLKQLTLIMLDGDWEAINDYNKAIELNPKHSKAYYNRGLAKGELKDYRGAIQDFNKAIELNPNYAKAYYNRGIAKILLGQEDNGCLDLSKAGELGYAEAYEAIKESCNQIV